MMAALIGAAHCTMSSLNFSLLPQSVNHTAQGNRSQMAATSQRRVHAGALCECTAEGLFVPEWKCTGLAGSRVRTCLFVLSFVFELTLFLTDCQA